VCFGQQPWDIKDLECRFVSRPGDPDFEASASEAASIAATMDDRNRRATDRHQPLYYEKTELPMKCFFEIETL
jgi:hypothetical protein